MKILLSVFLFLAAFASAQVVQPPLVQGGSISSVTAACNPNTVSVGQGAQCNATSYVQGVANIDVTNQGLWSSLNPALATITPDGTAACLTAGTPTISFNLGSGVFVATTNLTCGTAPLISQIGMANCAPTGTLCTLPPGTNTVGYNFQFSASGGVPFTSGNSGFPYQWAVTAGSLAGSGLSLGASSGALTGTAATGTYNFTVQATDTQPVSTTLAVTLVIAGTGNCGPPNYCAYQGRLILPPPKPPVLDTGTGLINNNAVVTDSSYNVYGNVPSGNLSTLKRCTDSRSGGPGNGGLQSYMSGLGGAGDAVVFNSNSTLALVDNGFGGYFVVLPSGGQCVAPSHGSPPANTIFITKNSDLCSGCGTIPGTTPMNIGGGQFSTDPSHPEVFWASGNADFSNGLWVVKTVFQGTGSGASFAPNGDFNYSPAPVAGAVVPTVDYEFGLPLGAQVSARVPSHVYAYGAYATYTLANLTSGHPEYQKWLANTAYVLGELIVPGDSDGNTTNPQGCAFKAQTPGTTGGSLPNFGSKNPCSNNSVTDGTVKWVGIAAPPVFVYQNVGTAGTSSGGIPVFIPRNCTAAPTAYAGGICHPDLASTASDGANIVWQNAGPDFVPSGNVGWSKVGGTSTDSTKFAQAQSTNTYGYTLCGNKKLGACYYYQAGQDTGWWLMAYDATLNRFALLNTMTGIQSNVLCTGGTGYNCAGGTWVWSSPATSAATAFQAIVAEDGVSLNCGFFLHGAKLSSGGQYIPADGTQPIVNPGPCGNVVSQRVWQPFATYDPLLNFQIFGHGMNHFALGRDHAFPMASNYGSTLGVLVGGYSLSNGSGNNGSLPPGCGAGAGQTACLKFSGSQPTFAQAPYAVSIAGSCQNAKNTTNTAFSIPITAASWAGSSATYTLGAGFTTYTYLVGAYVTVGGITPAGYSGQNLQVATSSAGSFTVVMSNPGAATLDANAAVYNQLPKLVYGQLPAAFANGGAAGAPDCNISTSIDTHISAAYNPGFTDTGRLGGYTYNIATLSPQPFSALQGELMAYTQSPLCAIPPIAPVPPQVACGSTNSQGILYRFFHSFNTGTNALFPVQFGITQFSQDGKYLMFGSDWGCTLGANGAQPGSATGSGIPVQDGTGQLGHLPVTSVPPSVQNFCGNPWVASTTYQVGNLINAIGNTTAGNATFDVFQAIAITGAGITGTTQPSFKTSNPPTAATAITVASEVGTTATITVTSATGLFSGGKLFVSGMTPSGYNCPSGCQIVGTAVNQVSYIATTSGLGAGSGFGSAYLLGTTFTDNQVTWQDVGPPNGRADVMLLTLN